MFKIRPILLGLSLLPLLSPLPSPCYESQIRDLPPCISVSGQGKVFARPNMAEINVGVVAESKNAADALKSSNESMSALIKTLAASGVAEKDVITDNFSVNPQYRYDNQPRSGKPAITGYIVNNQVHVRVRELSGLGKVLDALVENGANNVNGISFSIADPEPILDQARQKAVADARRKAELYALASGSKLGRVLYITESGGMQPQPPRPMAMTRSAAAQSEVPIAIGDQQSSISITVTYALE